MTRSRAPPTSISRSDPVHVRARPAGRRNRRWRESGSGRPARRSRLRASRMLSRLISETYLSVVALGLGRASAKAWPGASTTRSGPATAPPRNASKNAAISRQPCGLGQARPATAISLVSRRSSACRVSGVEARVQPGQRLVAHQHDEMASSTARPGGRSRIRWCRARSRSGGPAAGTARATARRGRAPRRLRPLTG